MAAPLPLFRCPSDRMSFALADGSVRFVRQGPDHAAYRAARTKAGGETIGLETS